MAKEKAVTPTSDVKEKAVRSSAAKVKVKLNHYSHRKGCEGQPGDVIEVDETTAAFLCELGCERCDDVQPDANDSTGN